MNRASNGNLGSRSRKRGWTDSVIPSRWVARQQPPRRLGSRRALIGASDSQSCLGPASSTAIESSQGRIRDSSFWPSARATAPRARPRCGAAAIGISVRRPGAPSWTRAKCRQRAFACRRLRGRRTVSLQLTSESARRWNRCDPANCRHRRSNGSSDATTVGSRGGG